MLERLDKIAGLLESIANKHVIPAPQKPTFRPSNRAPRKKPDKKEGVTAP